MWVWMLIGVGVAHLLSALTPPTRLLNPMNHPCLRIAIKALPGITAGAVLGFVLSYCIFFLIPNDLLTSIGLRPRAILAVFVGMTPSFGLSFLGRLPIVNRIFAGPIRRIGKLLSGLNHATFRYIQDIINREDRKAVVAIGADFQQNLINKLYAYNKRMIASGRIPNCSCRQQVFSLLRVRDPDVKVYLLLVHFGYVQLIRELTNLKANPQALLATWDGVERRHARVRREKSVGIVEREADRRTSPDGRRDYDDLAEMARIIDSLRPGLPELPARFPTRTPSVS